MRWLFVGKRSNNGAKQHGRSETSNKELTDLPLAEAISAVEIVHIGTLQPVPSWRETKINKVIRERATFIHSWTINQSTFIHSFRSDLVPPTNNNKINWIERDVLTHHERVDEEIVVLEGVEGGGGVNAVFVRFAQLQAGDDRSQPTEHHEVEDLHWYDTISEKMRLVISDL